jgi:hypothetical protein
MGTRALQQGVRGDGRPNHQRLQVRAVRLQAAERVDNRFKWPLGRRRHFVDHQPPLVVEADQSGERSSRIQSQPHAHSLPLLSLRDRTERQPGKR